MIDTSNSNVHHLYSKSCNSRMVVTYPTSKYLMTIHFIRCCFSNLFKCTCKNRHLSTSIGRQINLLSLYAYDSKPFKGT